MIPQLLDKDGV